MTLPTSGEGLEARLQRLLIALGTHAERGLIVRTSPQESRIVTDIDVLGVNYTQDFHRSVLHAECKGEKRAKTLDRMFWLVGVRKLLQADRSILVMQSHDSSSSAFARALEIETLSFNSLQELEDRYSISKDWWPGRTDYKRWDNLQPTRDRYSSLPSLTDELSDSIKQLYALCYEDAWRSSPYGPLNRLLRLMGRIAEDSKSTELTPAVLQVVRMSISYGLVRLSHYLLNTCQDLVIRQPSDRSTFLSDRLIFGNQNAVQMRMLTERYMRMMKSALDQYGVEPPARWETDFMLQTPKYQEALLETVQRLLDRPEQAVNLPLAMELVQFGFAPEPRAVVEAAVEAGKPAVGVTKALLTQEFSIPHELLEPPDVAILDSLAKPMKRPKKGKPTEAQERLIRGEQ